MKTRYLSILCAAAFLSTSLTRGFAEGGDPDLSFSQRGQIEGLIADVSVNPEGEICIVGTFSKIYGKPSIHFAILAPDGSLLFSMESHPVLGGLGSMATAVAADLNGGFYIGGPNTIVHLEKRGGTWNVDSSFSVHDNRTGTDVRGFVREVRSIAVTESGEVYVACNAAFSGSGFDKSFTLLRMTSSGGVDLSFNPPAGYVAQVRTPKSSAGSGIFTTEHLLVAGSFGAGSLSMSGSDLQVVGTDMGCVAERAHLPGLDCGLVTGRFIGGGLVAPNDRSPNYPLVLGMKLIRHDGSGLDSKFRSLPDNNDPSLDDGSWIAAIEALDAGDLLIAGNFSRLDGHNVRNLAHLLPDGKLDTSFRNQTLNVGGILAMTKQKDGRLILVGTTSGSPVRGTIERRLAMPAALPARIVKDPQNRTAYVGESVCLEGRIEGQPSPSASWYRVKGAGPSLVSSSASASLCFDNVSLDSAGDYQLVATDYCRSDTSRVAHLTVLPVPQPPPNDHFSQATTVSGIVSTTAGTVRSSTLQNGEPAHPAAFGGHSAWWTWTAVNSGIVTLDLSGSDFTAACQVYTGQSLQSLNEVASNIQVTCVPDGEGGERCFTGEIPPLFTFNATAGTVYHIAIGGTPSTGSPGNIVLLINPISFQTRSLSRASDGTFTLTITGPNGVEVSIQSTKLLNPAHWEEIGTLTLSVGPSTFVDQSALNAQRCYYRAVLK